MENQELFYEDDFFETLDPADEGDRVDVELRGRLVPIYFKKGMSFTDKKAAQKQSVKTRIKPNGQIEILSLDDEIFAVELLARSIKSWPFIKRDGSPLPVNRENIKRMFAENTEALTQLAMSRVNAKDKAKQPFTKPSENTSADHS